MKFSIGGTIIINGLWAIIALLTSSSRLEIRKCVKSTFFLCFCLEVKIFVVSL